MSLAGGGGRGVGVMVDRPLIGSGAVLRAGEDDFVLEPLGRRVRPIGLSSSEVSTVDNLLERAEWPLLAPPVRPSKVHRLSLTFCAMQHELVVHILGQVSVQFADGAIVGFDRSKAQELVVWLSQHRHRPTRSLGANGAVGARRA